MTFKPFKPVQLLPKTTWFAWFLVKANRVGLQLSIAIPFFFILGSIVLNFHVAEVVLAVAFAYIILFVMLLATRMLPKFEKAHKANLGRKLRLAVASWRYGAGKHNSNFFGRFNWRYLFHLIRVEQGKAVEVKLRWANENLTVWKGKRGIIFVTVHASKDELFHEHNLLRFVGVRSWFGFHSWFEVDTVCSADSFNSFERQQLFWLKFMESANALGIKHFSKPTQPDDFFLYPANPGPVWSGAWYTDDEWVSAAHAVNKALNTLPPGMDMVDMHTFYYHPELISLNPRFVDFEGVPTIFVKQMFGMPQELKLLTAC